MIISDGKTSWSTGRTNEFALFYAAESPIIESSRFLIWSGADRIKKKQGLPFLQALLCGEVDYLIAYGVVQWSSRSPVIPSPLVGFTWMQPPMSPPASGLPSNPLWPPMPLWVKCER